MSNKNWKVKQVSRTSFTYEEILEALIENDYHLGKSAKALTKLGRGKVSRQLLRYWVQSEDFEVQDENGYEAKQIVGRYRAMATARELRKDIKFLNEVVKTQEDWEFAIELGVSQILDTPPVNYYFPESGGTKLTVEILISDLQIGKVTSNYNTEIARKRVEELGRSILLGIDQKRQAGYDIERVVVAFLGDLIESDEKHMDSARACDSSTAEQMADCIEVLFKHILEPLTYQAPKVDIIGIGGNHDHNGHGLRSFQAGRTQLNYPIYVALKMLCKQVAPHVNFRIPEGVFDVIDIYGSKVLYEHGVGVQVGEASMKKRKHDRGEQIGEHIFYFRMG